MHHLFKLQEIKGLQPRMSLANLVKKKQWFVQSAEPDL